MWRITSGDGGRRLEAHDLYTNFDRLVKQASVLFKKNVSRQMGIRLSSVSDVGLANEDLRNSKIVTGTLVLRGSYRYGRNDGELFAGFNIKNGVLSDMVSTVCDEKKVEYPITRAGGKQILSKVDSDSIVDLQGKTIMSGLVAKFKRFAAEGDKKEGPALTQERPVKYNPTINKKEDIEKGRIHQDKLTRIDDFTIETPDKEKASQINALLTQIDSIVLSKRAIDKQVTELNGIKKGSDAEQQKLLKDLISLNTELEIIWNLGDKAVQIISKFEDVKPAKASADSVLGKLRVIPEYAEKIKQLEEEITKTNIEFAKSQPAEIQQEVHVADEVPAKVRSGQALDKVKNSLTERLKNLVIGFKELVSLVKGGVKGIETAYDEVVTGTSVPNVPGGDSAVGVGVYGTYSEPTSYGLTKFRRISKKLPDNKEVFSAWDKSDITDEEAKRRLKGQVLGENIVNNLADAAIEHWTNSNHDDKVNSLYSKSGADVWKYYMETAGEQPPAIGQKHWMEVANAITKKMGGTDVITTKTAQKTQEQTYKDNDEARYRKWNQEQEAKPRQKTQQEIYNDEDERKQNLYRQKVKESEGKTAQYKFKVGDIVKINPTMSVSAIMKACDADVQEFMEPETLAKWRQSNKLEIIDFVYDSGEPLVFNPDDPTEGNQEQEGRGGWGINAKALVLVKSAGTESLEDSVQKDHGTYSGEAMEEDLSTQDTASSGGKMAKKAQDYLTDETGTLPLSGESASGVSNNGVKEIDPKCPHCGEFLEDVGSYKWDCPNGCLPLAMELGQIEDSAKEGKM